MSATPSTQAASAPMVLALADEFALHPELLHAWTSRFSGEDHITLVILPGSWAPETVLAQLPGVLSAAGIDERPESPTTVVLTGPLDDIDFQRLRANSVAVYSATAPSQNLHGLDVTTNLEKLAALAVGGRQASTLSVDVGEQAEPSFKATVRSFDIFDTLIARRCIEPLRVFGIVEDRSGIADFAKLRRRAELDVAHQPYTLTDIYARLSTLLAVDADGLLRLQALEIEVESEQVIPIAENLRQVRHGDLLVSDMYLPATVISELLSQAGFDKRTGLVVTSDGKASGRIWPILQQRWQIETHTGDNEHSDVNAPARLGITSRHTAVHAPNAVETYLLDAGLRDVAQLCRELRLVTWSDDPDLRMVQLVQAGANIPLLLIGSVLLVRHLQRHNLSRVLFSSRDCYQWVPLFEIVATQMGASCSTNYFYTSRIARISASKDYLQYASSLMTADAVVVDVCGTGRSLTLLADDLGLSEINAFMLHLMAPLREHELIGPARANLHTGGVVGPGEPGFDNELLEMCNYADHGMIRDVAMVMDQAVPVLAADERSGRERAAVNTQLAMVKLAAERLQQHDLSSCEGADDDLLGTAFRLIYKALSAQSQIRALYGASHERENGRVVEALLGASR
ncbi:MAG: hypothetical protein ACP5H2_09260 [Solirubrobacteraceae bacterium]